MQSEVTYFLFFLKHFIFFPNILVEAFCIVFFSKRINCKFYFNNESCVTLSKASTKLHTSLSSGQQLTMFNYTY